MKRDGTPLTEPRCAIPFERGDVCARCSSHPGAPGVRICSQFVAESEVMRALLTRVSLVGASEASVIILGESGSGKELVARALHANSPRRAGPFIAINVAALPADLLESELFGHAKGAFTGANTLKRGLFEEAHGGTLLLDEIAEMPLGLQSKLLRALQDGEVRRVGDNHAFSVDVRVLCATHQDLATRTAERQFREDLYYRLRVFTLTVPPLRERLDDIIPLARAFLSREKHPTGRFTPEAERALVAHRWPGNVRELVNAVKHGAVLSRGADVDAAHLPEELTGARAKPAPPGALASLAEVEHAHVLRVLEACGGHHAETARVLGIGRTTLWRMLKDMGIERAP